MRDKVAVLSPAGIIRPCFTTLTRSGTEHGAIESSHRWMQRHVNDEYVKRPSARVVRVRHTNC